MAPEGAQEIMERMNMKWDFVESVEFEGAPRRRPDEWKPGIRAYWEDEGEGSRIIC